MQLKCRCKMFQEVNSSLTVRLVPFYVIACFCHVPSTKKNKEKEKNYWKQTLYHTHRLCRKDKTRKIFFAISLSEFYYKFRHHVLISQTMNNVNMKSKLN